MDATVEHAARDLADTLKAAEPVARLDRAHEALQARPHSQQALEQLQRQQRRLAAAQQRGEHPPEDAIARFQEAQQAAQADPAIRDYADAQQQVSVLMAALNEEISQAVGVDFGQLAGQDSC